MSVCLSVRSYISSFKALKGFQYDVEWEFYNEGCNTNSILNLTGAL
jgi:hypothetical protein